MRICLNRSLICLAALIAVLGLIGTVRPALAQSASDPKLSAAQQDLVRAQIETEKARRDYYNRQIEIEKKAGRPVSIVQKLFNDPADTVGELGAVLGMMIAFLVLMGNRSATRRHRRDEQFYEALRRFGDGSPSMRAASAGILAQMARVREGRSYPYLDTSSTQLIAGYRLEENEAVRQAISDALLELVAAEPIRIRRKLSDAKIKLPGD